MSITVNILYSGENGAARSFAEEMVSSGTVEAIRGEEGNIRYEYYHSMEDDNTVLLIDAWNSQEALDAHHESAMMNTIARLREKYNLHMKVERFISEGDIPEKDMKYIRK